MFCNPQQMSAKYYLNRTTVVVALYLLPVKSEEWVGIPLRKVCVVSHSHYIRRRVFKTFLFFLCIIFTFEWIKKYLFKYSTFDTYCFSYNATIIILPVFNRYTIILFKFIQIRAKHCAKLCKEPFLHLFINQMKKEKKTKKNVKYFIFKSSCWKRSCRRSLDIVEVTNLFAWSDTTGKLHVNNAVFLYSKVYKTIDMTNFSRVKYILLGTTVARETFLLFKWKLKVLFHANFCVHAFYSRLR